ncbi:MAG: ABC transporter permease subunit [Lentisphaerae bacterium]|nr:MAG: ABC transporter permease subunit [Lentisphaerota bacterium]
MTKFETSIFTRTGALITALLLLFLILPIVLMMVQTSPSLLGQTVHDGETLPVIGRSILAAVLAVGILSIPTLPAAWFLARRDFWGKRIVLALIDLPIVVPHTAAGIALLCVLNRKAPIGKVLGGLGIECVGNFTAIVIAMAYVSLPFLINAARQGFAAIPVEYEQMALTLGSSPLRVFFTISLPLAARSIIHGMIMMFARGVSEFGAVMILAYYPRTAPVLIYERFTQYGLENARALTVIFLLLVFAIFILLQWISGKNDHAVH